MNNQQICLEQLGFSTQEARVYRALLELGEANVADLAQKTGIKRTSVYPIIRQLLQKGVAQKMKKQKKVLYFVEDVRMLEKNIIEQRSVFGMLLPELEAIHNTLPKKPKITFYEGKGGMRDFYFRILDSLSPGEEICEYVSADRLALDIPESLQKEYPEERTRRKVRLRVITPASKEAEKWLENPQELLREVRVVQQVNNFSGNMQIYKKGIGIISYQDNFMGVIIESGDIAKMFKSAFELMWKPLNIV